MATLIEASSDKRLACIWRLREIILKLKNRTGEGRNKNRNKKNDGLCCQQQLAKWWREKLTIIIRQLKYFRRKSLVSRREEKVERCKEKEKQEAKQQKQSLSLSKEERKRQFEENEEKKRQQRKEKNEAARTGESSSTSLSTPTVVGSATTPTISSINTPTVASVVTNTVVDQKMKEDLEKLRKEYQHLEKQHNDLKKKYQESRIYSHLSEYQIPKQVEVNHENIHPAIIQLGMQYASGQITGCNARTIGLLTALKQFVLDAEVSEDKLLSRDYLDPKLVKCIDYLKQCRPMSIGMKSALRKFKSSYHHVDKLKELRTQQQRKEKVMEEIDSYIEERISYPEKQIIKHGVDGIKDGDTIMTYALSEVLERMIIEAAQTRKFRIVVVDSRPKNEGKELVKRLNKAGITCSLILINALSYMMKDVTKVFLGANSILSNGAVYSRVGTALVAMTAKAFNVPVIVCCETYKFSDQSQLDSITVNELGDPYDLVDLSNLPQRKSSVNYLSSNEVGHLEIEGLTLPNKGDQSKQQSNVVYNLENFESINNLHVINLLYDITPCHYVDMVITEFGAIPPTSIPVILREFGKDY
ncbi:hypothetical protein C9374_007683 [Naegleria lovaniensis]|uniref:Translation initiation factor eIF2B subunit delta n=1 Tax=Naegleria lovaniensis TaxID=51637 RepID=A0AA88KGZ4_NAELO|nr:uncharacterized protein C9374_007683 [Naegleria lovaniensis]KAG2379045.1 hypothetical protein C9374_007683 [Naegleria lovaniensis]